MKIIFLDIDGVLNNDTDDIIYLDNGGFYSPNLVLKLNKILSETGAKIVLSSTWRLGLSLQQAQDLLVSIGVSGEVIGITDSIWDNYVFRGNEIFKWIKDNENLVGKYYEYEDYVILDDDSDMLYWQRNNFVQTHGLKGLTDSNVMECIAILNGARSSMHDVNEYVQDFLEM